MRGKKGFLTIGDKMQTYKTINTFDFDIMGIFAHNGEQPSVDKAEVPID